MTLSCDQRHRSASSRIAADRDRVSTVPRLLSAMLLGVSMAVSAMGADTVQVSATTPQANEVGLAPAVFTLSRIGDGRPLTVSYKLLGNARSDLAGPYVFSFGSAGGTVPADLPNVFNGSVLTSSVSYFTNSLTLDVIGGQPKSPVQSLVIKNAGAGYRNGSYGPVSLVGGSGTGAKAFIDVVAGEVTGAFVFVGGSNYENGDILTANAVDLGGLTPTTPLQLKVVGPLPQLKGTATSIGGHVTSIAVSHAGSGYVNVPGVTIFEDASNATGSKRVAPNVGTGAFATATLTDSIASIVVTKKGSYALGNPPTVSAAGGQDFDGTVILKSLGTLLPPKLVDGGSGYTTVPKVTITGGGGTGATAKATIANGVVTGLTLTNKGKGYTSEADLVITIEDPPAAVAPAVSKAASAIIQIAAEVDSVTVTSGGSKFKPPVAITFSDDSGTAAVAAEGFGTVAVDKVNMVKPLFGGNYDPNHTRVVIGKPDFGADRATADATVSPSEVSGLNIETAGFGYILPSVSVVDSIDVSVANCKAVPVIFADATNAGVLDHIAVQDGGSGYFNPSLTISKGGGFGAAGYVKIKNGSVFGVTLTYGGSGYQVPLPTSGVDAVEIKVAGGNNDAVITATSAGQVIAVDPDPTAPGAINGGLGSGYQSAFPPVVLVVGGGGSGATISPVVDSTGKLSLIVTSPGAKYTSAPAIIIAGGAVGGSGARFKAKVGNGQIVGLSCDTVNGTGTGFPQPVVTITDGAGATPTAIATASATLENGRVTEIVLTGRGNGYTAPKVTAVDNFPVPGPILTNHVAQFVPVLCGPDFKAPLDAELQADGSLAGTVTFAADQTTVDLPIPPLRNGVAGARKVEIQIVPSIDGSYTVGAQASDSVTIADVDSSLSIATSIGTAHSTPPTLSNAFDALPIEVQGRAQWKVKVTDDTNISNIYQRQIDFTVGNGDSALSPITAAIGADYTLLTADVEPEDSNRVSTTLIPLSAAQTKAPSSTSNATVVGTTANVFTLGDFIAFSNPTDIYTGIYRVTASSNPAFDDNGNQVGAASLTFTPALNTTSGVIYDTEFNKTQVRFIGKQTTNTPSRYSFYQVSAGEFFLFAIPNKNDVVTTGQKAANISIIQSADYQSITPTSASVVIADDTALVNIQLIANAAQPGVPGSVQITTTNPFTRDIEIPFEISRNPGEPVLGADFTVDGVDVITRQGVATLKAGQRSVAVNVTPLGVTMSAPGTFTVKLLSSADYRLAPAANGTSNQNPSTQVSIIPVLQTSGKPPGSSSGTPAGTPKPVFLRIFNVQDGDEGSLTPGAIKKDVKFKVGLTDASGNSTADTDSLVSNLSFTYTLTGTAVAGTNYTGPTTATATIPASQSEVLITIPVRNDGRVALVDPTIIASLNTGAGFQVALGAGSVTANIVDRSPSISVASITGVKPMQGINASIFRLTNANIVNVPVTVRLALDATSTAVAGRDVNAFPVTAVIPANQASVDVSVDVLNGATVGANIIIDVLADTANPTVYRVGTSAQASATIIAGPVFSLVKIQDGAEGTTPTNGSFKIISSQPLTADVTVKLTIDATSTATPGASTDPGADYQTLLTSYDIKKGDIFGGDTTESQTVQLVVFNDALLEGTEHVDIRLAAGTGYQISPTNGTLSLNITDDEKSQVSFVTGSLAVSASEGTTAILTVQRLGDPSGSLNVTFSIADVSTTINADYTVPSSLTLSWADGDSANKIISIPIIADGRAEASAEKFKVTLTSATGGGTLASTNLISEITIPANPSDGPSKILFVSTAIAATEGTTAQVILKRVGSSEGTVTVTYQISDLTTSSADYTAPTGPRTVTWNDKDAANKTISIPIIADGAPEVSESFQVTLLSVESLVNTVGNGGGQLGDVSTRTAVITIPINDSPVVEVDPNARDVGDSSKSGCAGGSGIAVLLGLAGLVLVSLRRSNRIH